MASNHDISSSEVKGGTVASDDPMAGYDELHPSLRDLINSAPLSIDVPTALAHQRAVGVRRARADIIQLIQTDFPGYEPPHVHEVRLSSRDLALRLLRDKQRLHRRLRGRKVY